MLAATGSASSAVGGLISPGVATQSSRLGALTNVVACRFNDDDTVPTSYDQPFQMRIGSSPFALFVGSTVLTVIIFLLVPLLVVVAVGVLGCRPQASPVLSILQRRLFSTLFFTCVAYFGPTVVKCLVLVAWHSTVIEDSVLMGICALVVLLIWGASIYVVGARFQVWAALLRVEAIAADRWSNVKPSSMFCETFGPLFDAAKNTSLIVRVYFLEEFTVTIALQIIDGIWPQSGSCAPMAIAMLVFCVLHLLYTVAVRPHDSKLEQALFAFSAALLVAVAVTAVALTLGSDNPTTQQVFGVLSLINTGFFFLQAGVLGVAAIATQHKRRVQRQWTKLEEDHDALELEVPLASLTLNAVGSADDGAVGSTPVSGNPLHRSNELSDLSQVSLNPLKVS